MHQTDSPQPIPVEHHHPRPPSRGLLAAEVLILCGSIAAGVYAAWITLLGFLMSVPLTPGEVDDAQSNVGNAVFSTGLGLGILAVITGILAIAAMIRRERGTRLSAAATVSFVLTIAALMPAAVQQSRLSSSLECNSRRAQVTSC